MQAESSLEFTHFHARVVRAAPCPPLAAVWSALPCLHSVRTASPQPCFSLRRACRRVRPHRSTIGRLPSGASASLRHRSAQRPLGLRGRCGARLARARWRLWDGSPLRHRGFRFPRDAQSIRECVLHGLVGIPPCALQRRLAASCASRRRIRSGHVVSAAHPARAIRKVSAQALPLAPLHLRHASASHFIGTSGAPCVPLVSLVSLVPPTVRLWRFRAPASGIAGCATQL